MLHDAPLCQKQRRLLGDVYTLAVSKTLTLLVNRTNCFFSTYKRREKEIEESNLHGSASFKSIITPARQLLDLFIQRWWRKAAARQLTSLQQQHQLRLCLGEAASGSSRHFLFHWGSGMKTMAAEKAESHELRLRYISTHSADVGWDANQRRVFQLTVISINFSKRIFKMRTRKKCLWTHTCCLLATWWAEPANMISHS